MSNQRSYVYNNDLSESRSELRPADDNIIQTGISSFLGLNKSVNISDDAENPDYEGDKALKLIDAQKKAKWEEILKNVHLNDQETDKLKLSEIKEVILFNTEEGINSATKQRGF